MKDINLLTSNGINVEKSLEIFGDMDTYNESLGDFSNEVNEKLAKIESFKEVTDMVNYAILVHSLKSDAKYFGFEKLADLAYQHELESKANNINFVYDNYETLITEAHRITNVVNQYLGKTEVVNIIEPKLHIHKDKAILVIDDSNLITNFIRKIFDDTFEVLVAKDGSEAITILEKNDISKIAGVLLDLNMPNVDGFSVLEYFKQNNLFTKIPVSIITGNDSKDIDRKVFNYPIVDMLKKPFNERDVKNIVERTILFSNQEL